MAERKNDGGPAFGGIHIEQFDEQTVDGAPVSMHAEVSYPGMSLRDWFAGQVLYYVCDLSRPHVNAGNMRSTAALAYAIADAMLAERGRTS